MRQARARRTRQAILSAAAEVFDREGYDRASLSDILRAAGTTKGALYFHFASKDQLAEAVMEAEAALWSDLFSGAKERSGGGVQGLIDFSFAAARQVRSNTMVRAGNRLRTERRCGGHSRTHPPLPWMKATRDFVHEAAARDELRSGLDPEVAADAVAVFSLGLLTFVQAGCTRDLEAHLTGTLELLISALANDPTGHAYRIPG